MELLPVQSSPMGLGEACKARRDALAAHIGINGVLNSVSIEKYYAFAERAYRKAEEARCSSVQRPWVRA